MRFTTAITAAGLASSANAAVAKRTFGNLFKEFNLPPGINYDKSWTDIGPWDKPGDGEETTWHPPHIDIDIDGCDKKKDHDWHYVHNPSPGKHHEDKYKWVTETITATETVIDCPQEEPCYGGGKTVTVTIPETVTICPTPIEPPVEHPTEPPVEPQPEPPVEPPAEPTPYPPPPVEEPPVTDYPVPTHEPVPEPPVEEPPVEEPPVEEPPVEEPEPGHSEVPVPPPAPEPTVSEPIVYPPPPVETESIPVPPPAETSNPIPTATDDESIIPTAAAVPNAQRAGGAIIAAALAAALL